jgi:hypothetical protein
MARVTPSHDRNEQVGRPGYCPTYRPAGDTRRLPSHFHSAQETRQPASHIARSLTILRYRFFAPPVTI